MAYIQEELNFNPYRLVDVTIFKSDGWNEYQSPATILVYKDNYDYDTMGKESWFLCMSELEYSKDKNKIINLYGQGRMVMPEADWVNWDESVYDQCAFSPHN